MTIYVYDIYVYRHGLTLLHVALHRDSVSLSTLHATWHKKECTKTTQHQWLALRAHLSRKQSIFLLTNPNLKAIH